MQHLDKIVGYVGAVVIAAVMVISAAYVHVNTTQHKAELMAKDISNALAKGVDPITVRCAYAEADDTICLVHAASRQGETKVLLQPTK